MVHHPPRKSSIIWTPIDFEEPNISSQTKSQPESISVYEPLDLLVSMMYIHIMSYFKNTKQIQGNSNRKVFPRFVTAQLRSYFGLLRALRKAEGEALGIGGPQ